MGQKIFSRAALLRLLKRERSGKRVVFTNGCFDILHAGHLKVFNSCRRLGDIVVVGVNSDRSVRRLKGPHRPIVSQRDRAAVLAALESVDAVVMFDEDTPASLIRLIRPDVLVKGGDWSASQIVGREAAGKVVRVPLEKGRSTTGLIERILSVYGKTTTTRR